MLQYDTGDHIFQTRSIGPFNQRSHRWCMHWSGSRLDFVKLFKKILSKSGQFITLNLFLEKNSFMESNINHDAIEAYSKKFTESICERFFAGKMYIKADEIIHLTPVQQVNYFILKTLFREWKLEINKLKSPYFDYDNQEVQDSLKDFLNVLSRHILIKREDLEPLLRDSILNSIIMIFSPYEYFLQEINNPDLKQLSIQDLQELKKYVKVNEHLLTAYIKKFEDEGIEAVFSDDAVRMFNEVVESTGETPDEFDMYLKQFSEVVPLTDEIVFSPTIIGATSEEAPETHPTPPEPESEAKTEEIPPEEGGETLHDTFNTEQQETLADMHMKQPSEDLKKSITLNQRFMFVNDLFQGSMDDYEMAIGVLENCKNLDEAMNFIKTSYFEKNVWDPEQHEVREFVEVVQRRFPE
jgi:hypothetical protein